MDHIHRAARIINMRQSKPLPSTSRIRAADDAERSEQRATDLRAAADTMEAEGITWGGPDHADGWNAAIKRLRELAEEGR